VLLAVAVALVVVGLAGVVLPAIPGTLLIFAGLWLAAWSDGFMRVGAGTIVVLGVLAAATYFVDAAMMALGMKRLGTSGRAMAGAAVGMAVGMFFGLPGLIVGPFAGAVLGELTAHRDLGRAGRARGCGHRPNRRRGSAWRRRLRRVVRDRPEPRRSGPLADRRTSLCGRRS